MCGFINHVRVWIQPLMQTLRIATNGNVTDAIPQTLVHFCITLNFNVNVSNSFAPLAGIPGDDSIFLSSVLSPRSTFEPRVHSSPNTQTDMQTNPCTSTSVQLIRFSPY